MKQFICKTASDMEVLGRKVANTIKNGNVISLRGSLGAGKTVFVKGVAKELGITEAVVSPTFTIIQDYEINNKEIKHMYHLDLYRITSVEDFIMTGGEDILTPAGVCLIEWSEIIDEILPEGTIFVKISINDDSSRTVEIEGLDI